MYAEEIEAVYAELEAEHDNARQARTRWASALVDDDLLDGFHITTEP